MCLCHSLMSPATSHGMGCTETIPVYCMIKTFTLTFCFEENDIFNKISLLHKAVHYGKG